MNPLCKVRDIQRALELFEQEFEHLNGISLKEGMVLCSLSEGNCTASELAAKIDLTCSNCSKVISSVERKGYIIRNLGETDKRNMFFTLSDIGNSKLAEIKQRIPDIPELLK